MKKKVKVFTFSWLSTYSGSEIFRTREGISSPSTKQKNSLLDQKDRFLLLLLSECFIYSHMPVGTCMRVWAPLETRRGCQISMSWSCRQL